MNDKAQQWGLGMVIGIVVLVVSVIIFANMVNPLKEGFDEARHQDSLNCVQTSALHLCNTSTAVPCYNSSKDEETLACTFIDLGLPLIVIFFVLGAIGAMMANKFMQPQPVAPTPYGY